jgi:hypothetical protein
MTTPTNDWGKARSCDARLDGGGLDLGQSYDGDERHEQQAQADVRLAVGGWVGVLVLERLAVVLTGRKKSRWRRVWVDTNMP